MKTPHTQVTPIEPTVEQPVTPVPKEASPYTIILGTAHLSSTPGKRSPDGTFREYLYSREICNLVYRELKERGYKCVIDYEGDDMPGLNSSQELVKRVSIVNNLQQQLGRCIYVSIHVNAAGNGKEWKNATGWSAWTTRGQNNSDKLANCLYDAAEEILTPLKKKIRTDKSDGDRDYESNFYVIKNSNCICTLTENFFMDSKQDCEWLLSDEGKKAITAIHVEGIKKYIEKYI